ncbi:tetratricopeptide repeat protein [Rhodopirellula sp. JC740]|uniref:Tetratricopeptide repeat protein n=1 Tax=Rhodopirellula halodulae TaxID=2894198 RepID=A0ABS8NIW7_9BACT|nr:MULTISPECIES: tetratricopeptide repeat protein [unclassified Rhodopirellula]MCC9643501.1 tetratricopeptide repeat protein [Rhodopirellula sp. JC740]MCC9658107.1 tetratricopeptide repeat protein [Rhodopirellula sp. JC737]
MNTLLNSPQLKSPQMISRLLPLAVVCLLFNALHATPIRAAKPGQPVVARVEMQFAKEDQVVDVIAKGDLLTVVEDRGEDYVIVTHDGTRGAVDKVNAVELAESTGIYSELIEENPDEGRYHTLRASAWWALGEQEKAMADFNEAIEKGYEEAHAYSSRGLFHAARGEHEKAIKDYERALELDPEDITPIINRAAVRMAQRKFDAAIADYTEALEVREGNAGLLRQRALAYKSAGQMEKAIEDYDAIVDDNPEDVAAVMGRGYIRFQQHNYAAAAADFSAALELNEKDPVAWNNRGYNRYQLGKAKDALADYDRAIELAPEYALAHQNRAWLLATTEDESLRDPDAAVEAAKKACELNGYGNVSDLSALAAALAAQGEFKEAVGWQEKVVESAPEDAKTFASKILDRYRAGKPYIADPIAAEKTEQQAAEAAAKKKADKENAAAKKEAAKRLSEQAEKEAKASGLEKAE